MCLASRFAPTLRHRKRATWANLAVTNSVSLRCIRRAAATTLVATAGRKHAQPASYRPASQSIVTFSATASRGIKRYFHGLAEDLRLVLRRQRLGWLQLEDEDVLHQQVGHIVPDPRYILVVNSDGMLLLHIKSSLSQTMRQCGFVHLLQVTMAMVNVDVIGRLPHLITQRLCVFHVALRSLRSLRLKEFLLTWFRPRLGKVLHFEAVVVVAPFATGPHGLR